MNTSEAVEAMVRVMGPYIGETMARSATEAHCQKLGIVAGPLPTDQLDALLAKLGSGLNIFVGREKSTLVLAEVRKALAALEASR
jgi:hypothetical protein